MHTTCWTVQTTFVIIYINVFTNFRGGSDLLDTPSRGNTRHITQWIWSKTNEIQTQDIPSWQGANSAETLRNISRNQRESFCRCFSSVMRHREPPARLRKVHAQYHTAWASGVPDWGDASVIELLNATVSFRAQKFSEFVPQRLPIDTGIRPKCLGSFRQGEEKRCLQTTVSNLIYGRITRKHVWRKMSFLFVINRQLWLVLAYLWCGYGHFPWSFIIPQRYLPQNGVGESALKSHRTINIKVCVSQKTALFLVWDY